MSQPDPRMRIADSDRERAMADLAGHYAEGRLDHEEYDERLDAIWTARTRADLALLFSDLPRPQAPQPSRAPARVPRPAGSRSRFPLLPIVLVLLALSVLTEAPFWLLVIPLVWFRVRRRRASGPAAHRPQGWSHQSHGHTDYRRPRGSHGW
ncbi:hypothetical protein GCM10011376_15220 [Nocardioides flavus (ex Wang et al. 2016)]|uniref:DUF1707 domain-containing protein n=1 Tax=Nocardioides flavus (ex Wang et al. 2016) TaxID=2058780 RepID=A0ABQ3HJS1_9ACTN|nr:DUF1707 domain-containing protein [Nocardioides flavus (ex Wang et al. 2016)]GHE16912.1 hypothetical protein GCM10011376_15220 [Nocardioides flavus (ex Wang et al. 2016)]